MNDSNEPALASGAHGCETELQELCFHKHLSTSGIVKPGMPGAPARGAHHCLPTCSTGGTKRERNA